MALSPAGPLISHNPGPTSFAVENKPRSGGPVSDTTTADGEMRHSGGGRSMGSPGDDETQSLLLIWWLLSVLAAAGETCADAAPLPLSHPRTTAEIDVTLPNSTLSLVTCGRYDSKLHPGDCPNALAGTASAPG